MELPLILGRFKVFAIPRFGIGQKGLNGIENSARPSFSGFAYPNTIEKCLNFDFFTTAEWRSSSLEERKLLNHKMVFEFRNIPIHSWQLKLSAGFIKF